MKWKRTSRQSLPAYSAAVDYFFARSDLCFRVIVIDQSRLDVNKYHGGDWERAFYVFYYELLHQWMTNQDSYTVLLDKIAPHHQSRIDLLNGILRTKLGAQASRLGLHAVDSSETPLIQLADLLTGAVAASWCDDVPSGSPKDDLIRHIAGHLGRADLRFSSPPSRCKFNSLRIPLKSHTCSSASRTP